MAQGRFSDVGGTFDNISYEPIKRAAPRRGIIPASTFKSITSTLSSRIIKASVEDESATVYAVRGCPQGGVLSPLLWLFVVEDLVVA